MPRGAVGHNRAVVHDAQAARPPVLVFGAHIAALGVLRTLSRRGIQCFVADETSDVISRSRWRRSPGRTLVETPDSEVVDAYLHSLDLPGAVLIGCSDRWSLAIAGLSEATRRRFPASAPLRETTEQFVDKGRFRKLVERLEIPHPRGLPVNAPDDLDAVADEQLENGFLKPTESQLYRKHFRTKGSFVHSRDEAVRVVEAGRAAGISFVFQEWIPGGMGATVLIDGFVDRNGTIAAMMARRRVRENPARIGNTVVAVTIPLTEVEEATVSLRRLFAEVGYRGVFNAEFKYDARDGHFKVIEINARPAWFIGAIASLGVNLPWMSYLDAQGLAVPRPKPYPIGRYTVYEFGDAAAMSRALRSFRRPEGAILRPWLTGDRALFWWSDPMPAVGGAWQAVARRAGRALGGVRRAPSPTE
jgi:D-aspartate ligase